jgi:hypothetical protein
LSCVLLLILTPSVWAADFRLRGALLSAEQVSAERIETARKAGANAIALAISGQDREREKRAAELIERSDVRLYYWIEVGRCVPLADEHPEWLSSLQGHPEWRRFHKDFPQPKSDEIVKAYPWVPILYREAFEAHQARLAKLLEGLPETGGIFLNDLQGGPSACGCGHPLCRWTSDYGPLRTATLLGDDAAAKFVAAAKKVAPRSQIIPVWTTECEEHDGAKDGLCAGVGCFKGICWKAYSRQLAPLAAESDEIGVLLLYKQFQRDLPEYREPAGWVWRALRSFETMPPKNGGKAVATGRLIAVLQGYDATDKEIAAQIAQAQSAGAAGYVVSYVKIEQDWSPRIVKLPASKAK